MKPSQQKPFSVKKSDFKEINDLINNAMNNKQPQKGYRASSQNDNSNQQNDDEQVKNISSRPQFNLRKGTDRGRDSPYQESTEDNEFTSSQAESSQNNIQMFKPQKMAFKKTGVSQGSSSKQNEIDQLIQNEMQSKQPLKKPSIYDNLKPFAKKPTLTATKPTSDTNIDESSNNNYEQQSQPLSNSILTKPSLGRPMRKGVDYNTDQAIKVEDEDANIPSTKPFDKKGMLNPSRMSRNQPQQIMEEEEQQRANSQTKTINIKKKIENKIKQQINYVPIQNPILINKQESDEYQEEFDEYVEDNPKPKIVAKPNLPIPQKGEIDWKEQERIKQEEEERQKKIREEERKRKQEEDERRKEEERQKDEQRRREIQKTGLINIHNHLQQSTIQQLQQGVAFSTNQPGGLLVGRQGQERNIFAEPSYNQLQPDSYQQNFDQVPTQPAIQQQPKGKTKPVLKDKYREEQNGKFQQPQQQIEQMEQENRNQQQGNKRQLFQQQQQQQQQQQKYQQENEYNQKQQEMDTPQQQQQQQQQFEYARHKYKEEDQSIYNNFTTKEVKLQPQYNPQGEYQEGDEVKINLNIGKSQNKGASQAKIETQQERVKDLKNLIQLELDTFETLFELQPTTDYEIYINKIKSGTLKNSADQSDDTRVTKDIQVDLFQQNDFGNQCPEDQTRTFLKANIAVQVSEGMSTQTEPQISDATKNLDDATKLIEFMNNTYPIFEEILNSEKQVNQNVNDDFISEEIRRYPIPRVIMEKFLIQGVRATLNDVKDTYICYDIAQEGKEWFRISLIIKYTNFRITKYCITQSQVSSLALSNNILIAGTKDGSLNLWDLRETDFSHQKVSNKYIDAIKEDLERNEDLINSAPTSSKSLSNDEDNYESNLAFRFPSFTTDYLFKNADLLNEDETSRHSSSVIKILINTKNTSGLEFFSLEEFGKVIVWNLLELSQQEAERNYVEFGKYTNIKVMSQAAIDLSSQIFMNPDSICFDIQLDSQENHLYVCSSLGIIKADKFGNNKIKHPRVFGETYTSSFPSCLFVSNETELLVAGYSDGSIKLYSKNFKDPLLSLTNFTRQKITKILVNEQTNKSTNKKYYDINRLIASDATGNIFIFDLSINQSSPIRSYSQISRVNVSQKKAVSVQSIPDKNAVEILIQDGQNVINSFKWSYDDLVEKNPKKIYDDMKKLELIIPTYYHDFDFGYENEIII